MLAACWKPGGTIRDKASKIEQMHPVLVNAFETIHVRLHHPPLLFMIPTLFGIMLVSFVVVQFAPGGPVERVIAQLSGSDTGATLAHLRLGQGGDFGARGAQGGSRSTSASPNIAARRASIRNSSRSWKSSSASTSRPTSASS